MSLSFGAGLQHGSYDHGEKEIEANVCEDCRARATCLPRIKQLCLGAYLRSCSDDCRLKWPSFPKLTDSY